MGKIKEENEEEEEEEEKEKGIHRTYAHKTERNVL